MVSKNIEVAFVVLLYAKHLEGASREAAWPDIFPTAAEGFVDDNGEVLIGAVIVIGEHEAHFVIAWLVGCSVEAGRFFVILLQTQPSWALGEADGEILAVRVVEIDIVKVVEIGVGFGLWCRGKQRSCSVVAIEIETLYGIFHGAVGGDEQADDAYIIVIPVFVQSAGELVVGIL